MILGVETPSGIKAPESVPCHMALLTNVASVMTGMKRYYKKIGKDVKVVSFVGDGATADIGFQPLSGAAERGENIIYICYDNDSMYISLFSVFRRLFFSVLFYQSFPHWS